MTAEYRQRELTEAKAKFSAARTAWDNAKTRAARASADEDLQFWGSKVAYLEAAGE